MPFSPSRKPVVAKWTPLSPYACTMPPEFQISIPLLGPRPYTGWTVQVKLMIWTETGEVVGGKRALVCGGRHAGRKGGGAARGGSSIHV